MENGVINGVKTRITGSSYPEILTEEAVKFLTALHEKFEEKDNCSYLTE